MTIYESTTGGLVTTGDRSISRFPSGLVRIDQTYVGATGYESEHRALLADGIILPSQSDDPTLDGLYILGGAQEMRDGLGFTKYQVSGYGRLSESAVEFTRTQKTLLIRKDESQFSLKVIVYDMTGVIVKPRGEVVTPDDFSFESSFLMPLDVSYLFHPYNNTTGITEINSNNRAVVTRKYRVDFEEAIDAVTSQTFSLVDPSIRITAQRSFGKWSEFEYELIRESELDIDEL